MVLTAAVVTAAVGTASAVVGLAVPAIQLSYKVIQAAPTATQNKAECDDLAERLSVLCQLLDSLRLEGPWAAKVLSGLCDALREAHELVDDCQNWSTPTKFAFSSDHAERFVRVNRRIHYHIDLIKLCMEVETRLDKNTPPAPTSIVAADVYKRFESDATAAVDSKAQRTRNQLEAMIESKARWKKSATGRIVRATLGIVFLNPGYVILAASGV